MSRPRRDAYVQWKINLEATLAARIEMVMFDPIHGKPRYAERSRLIQGLLERWLSEQGGVLAQAEEPRPPPA